MDTDSGGRFSIFTGNRGLHSPFLHSGCVYSGGTWTPHLTNTL